MGRLRVLISSTQNELKAERDAVEAVVADLGCECVRAETHAAPGLSPEEACREMARTCDAYVGIFGGRYGFTVPNLGCSATEMEYREARLTDPRKVLVYVKDATEIEEEQRRFLVENTRSCRSRDRSQSVTRQGCTSFMGYGTIRNPGEPSMNAVAEALQAIVRQIEQGETTQAYRSLQALHNAARSEGDRNVEATALHLMGLIAHEQGRPDEAMALLEKSIESRLKLEDRQGLGASYHQLGIVLQDQGRYKEARDLYERALQIAERLGNLHAQASAFHQLGIVVQNQGQYQEALQWYERTLLVAQRLGDRRAEGSAFHQLGMIAQYQGRYQEARIV
jgi:tetratricopeptide (TPR) repeat protein